MSTLIEYLPLVLFFVFYKFADIYWATGILIAATAMQLGYQYFKHKHVATRHWVFFGAAVVLGTMTILFRDEQFIQWKATFVYASMSLALLISRYIWQKNLVKKSLMSLFESALEEGQRVDVPESVWDKLNLMWVIVLAVISGANIYVAYHYSLDTWVTFKVFGLTGVTFVMLLATLAMLYKYLPADQE